MNDPTPQHALREWRTHMTTPVRMAVLAAIIAILTLMGPFNTGEVMRALPRLAYWAVLVLTCYSIGYFANVLAAAWTKGKGVVLRAALAAVMTTLGVLAVVYLLNGLAINYWATGMDLAIIALNVLIISSIITMVFYIADQTEVTIPPTPPALLDRLPLDKRGPLVSLTVEDHYVRIRTTKGEDMVLLRLADAVREVGDTAGLQVHRSHWVALNQITSANRKGDGAILSMTHGPDIPVSRANVPAIRDAGLLPKVSNG